MRRARFVIIVMLAAFWALSSAAPGHGAEEAQLGVANLRLDYWGYGYNCDFFFGGVSVGLTNTGTEATSDFAIFLELDGAVFAWLYRAQDLGPGETANLGPTGTRDIVLGDGLHSFKVLVDPGDRVPESTDVDNLGTNEFIC